MDLTEYQGKPVQAMLDDAVAESKAAIDHLKRAITLFRATLQQDLSEHDKGKIRMRLWTAEQAAGMHREFSSQGGQDRYLCEEVFEQRRSGTFLEIGGYDGRTGSNTWYLENELGWRGVIVEPSPVLAEQARQCREASVIEVAVSDGEGEAEFLTVESGYTQMGGLVNSLDAATLRMVRQHPQHSESTIRVPTMSLNGLIKTLDLGHIDLCCIDVEGAERAILGACDWAGLSIGCFVIENNRGHADGGVQDLLVPNGYELKQVIGFDEIYVRRDAEAARGRSESLGQ